MKETEEAIYERALEFVRDLKDKGYKFKSDNRYVDMFFDFEWFSCLIEYDMSLEAFTKISYRVYDKFGNPDIKRFNINIKYTA